MAEAHGATPSAQSPPTAPSDTTLSSAVLLPQAEPTSDTLTPTGATKRRQSSSSLSPHTKRARLATLQPSAASPTTTPAVPVQEPTPTPSSTSTSSKLDQNTPNSDAHAVHSPATVSSTAKQDNDTKQLRRPTGPRVLPDHDKGRNKRLFGSLLGTLAQPARTSTVSSKRKDDIERKQAAKLRQRDEEFAASARDRESEALVRREEQAVRDETQAARREEQATSRAELDEKRKQQQRAWDEESTRIRHANMRAMAGFLLTEAEPRLYWRPWEMLRGQEERVERRREEVEEGIRRELDDAGPEPSHTNGVAEAFEADTSDISAPRRTSGGQPGDAAGSEPGDEKRLDGSGAAPVEGTRASVLPAGTSAEHQGAGDTHLLEENGDDHENDEVANAGEDAVIY